MKKWPTRSAVSETNTALLATIRPLKTELLTERWSSHPKVSVSVVLKRGVTYYFQIWPINCMPVSDKFYHRECSKCSSCGAGSDPGKPMVLRPANRYAGSNNYVIYCQGCAQSIPKVTALSITEATTIIPEPGAV